MKESIKSIFNWNHISDELTEEQVEELKSYYNSYHSVGYINKLINIIKCLNISVTPYPF